MIYLIDDTNLDNMNALYVKDEKYVGIIHLINNVHDFSAHPTNPVECCADANPKTMLPNDT